MAYTETEIMTHIFTSVLLLFRAGVGQNVQYVLIEIVLKFTSHIKCPQIQLNVVVETKQTIDHDNLDD